MKRNQGSIQIKVSKMTVRMALASALVVALIASAALFALRGTTVAISGDLGDAAASDSRAALEAQTIDRLGTLCRTQADLADSRLLVVQHLTEMLADKATSIAAHPSGYPRQPISAPNGGNAGAYSTQLMLAEGTEWADIQHEALAMGNMSDLLLSVAKHNEMAHTAYAASELGYTLIVDESADRKGTYFDARQRDWYKKAAQAGRLAWSDVYDDVFGGGLEVMCAAPYYGADGRLSGVVGCGAFLKDMVDIVLQTHVGQSGYAFLVNEEGQLLLADEREADEDVLAHSALLASKNAELAEVARRMVKGETGLDTITLDGDACYIAFAPLSTVPWSLATVMDVDEAVAPAAASEQRIIADKDAALHGIDRLIRIVALACLGVLAAVLLAIRMASRRFSRTLTDPIVALRAGVGQIAEGKLAHRIALHTGDEIEQLGDSVNKMALDLQHYIENLERVTSERERIAAELGIANRIQASMLPRDFKDRDGFELYAAMRPAKEVGGDFYDFFPVDDDHMAVVIADVSGKGVPAALFMVVAMTLIKTCALRGAAPAQVFEQVNELLCERNEQNMFVTAFLGLLTLSTGELTYVNAGHNPPLVCQGGAYAYLKCRPGFVLAGMPGIRYRQATLCLAPGDALLLYTDGVTEAVDSDLNLFGEARLSAALNARVELGPRALIESVQAELDQFGGGAEAADDITMLALRFGWNAREGNRQMDQITLDARTENLDKVLAHIQAALDRVGCPAKAASQIAVAAEEIFVNIAHYAYGEGGGPCTVAISAANGQATLTFQDRGHPYDPLEKGDPDITLGAEDREIGGLGVFMVKQIMDSIQYRREGGQNLLTLKKRFCV